MEIQILIKKHEYLKSLMHPLLLSCDQLLNEKQWLTDHKQNYNHNEVIDRLQIGLTLLENDKQ